MFRPLLAEKVNLETLQYPCFASPKYDGFRCLIRSGNPVSRNMKNVANHYVFGKLSEMGLPPLDGELLTYTGDKVDDFNTTQSKLSTRSGMPDFKYMVFDLTQNPTEPFSVRDTRVGSWFADTQERAGRHRLEHVVQTLIHDEEELLDYEAKQLALGWEGVMVRSVDGYYKQGRSTTKEGILLKLKRFFDAEAVVISAHELVSNQNEAVTNALGYTERSSHKENMVGRNMLGKFTVKWGDVEFDVGTGFNERQRMDYWETQDLLVGRTLTFKYQSLGPNGKPRFPVFLGFRNDL